ncbi:MAG TPA: acyltransferase [Candidatus Binatia bacterium]|nr:acyltransferase [Candidatus Binatia bacterium]
MTGAEPAAERREHLLDGVRGVAILMVLAAHCLRPEPVSALSGAVFGAVRWMMFGVDLFFVLSGYLITDILIRTRRSPAFYTSFYARRALRILPAYYLVLAAIFLGGPHLLPLLKDEHFAGSWPWFAVYLQNWRICLGPNLYWDGAHHLWSLAIEEQYYLLWPLVVRLAAPSQLPRICALVFGLVVISKLVLWGLDFEWWRFYGLTTTRADALAAGAWIAAVRALPAVQGQAARVGVTRAAAAVAFAVMFCVFWGTLVSEAIVALVTPVVAVLFASSLYLQLHGSDAAAARMLRHPVLAWFARYSYGIYLWHWPVLRVLQDRGLGAGWFAPWLAGGTNGERIAIGVIAMALAIPAAVAMFHAMEAPLLRLKRLFPYAGARALATPAPP